MIKEYSYRPPFKYFFVGLCGNGLAITFGLTVFKAWFSWLAIICGIFSLMGLALGIAFLVLFFRKINVGRLKLGLDFIEIPGRWKKRTRIDFDDIIEMGEIDSYDHVIEIESKQGFHLIERNWMKRKEFDRINNTLRQFWENKSY